MNLTKERSAVFGILRSNINKEWERILNNPSKFEQYIKQAFEDCEELGTEWVDRTH